MKNFIFLFLILGMAICNSSWAHMSKHTKSRDIFQNESSILGVRENRLHLNPARLGFSGDSVLLDMDLCGTVYLDEVRFDGRSYYYEGTELAFGLGYLYVCTTCGAMYSKDPKTFRSCGGTDFTISDLYPENRQSS